MLSFNELRERIRERWRNRKPANRGTIVKAISIFIIVLALLFIGVSIFVYTEAVNRFEVRRVALPTRIFTDMYEIRPGVEVTSSDFRAKLDRLGYRETESPAQPGDFAVRGTEFDIFLRPFKHPEGDHRPERIGVMLQGRAITAVRAAGGGASETAAFEPELLTSILGDQLENRRPATLDQIPQHMKDALIVTEDLRFWKHPGVDPLGIMRALFRNVKGGGVSEGGSTLTQQLVKNYYLTNERTYKRKIVEAFMSVVLDAKYSKQEILEAYLNDVYLGRNRSISILGVGEAARFYFGKPIGEITIGEASLLAGMIRGPNNYSPFTAPERAIKRRNTVIGLMLKHKKVTKEQYDAALAEPLPKKPTRTKSGLSSIPFYVDLVLLELKRDFGIDQVKGRGLSIYTSIDLDWQDTAARTLDQGLRGLETSTARLRRSANPLEGVMIAVDVPTGEVRALVGGRNYNRSQFNRALSAKRQVGSLFKPFVLLAAFEPSLSGQNITPATQVNDTRFTYKKRFSADWSPRNYNEQYYGVVTVRRALEQSMNAASVRIGLAAGVDAVIKAAQALGVQTKLDPVPSLILGSVEIPPIEMADAYATIARMGNRLPLRTVRYVTDDGGRKVAGAEEIEPVQVFPARDVYLAVHVMEGVVDRGTAASSRALGFKKSAAGKTGTTNDKRDAWFIGFTPRTLVLTWVGFDDNAPVGISGSEGAVPIWTRYMKEITVAERDSEFTVPNGINFSAVDANTGGLATVNCPAGSIVNEAFKMGTEPSQPCALHTIGMLQPGAPVLGPDGLPYITPSAPSPEPGGFLEGGTLTGGTQPLPPEPVTPVQPPPTQPPVIEPPPVIPPQQDPPPEVEEPPATETAPPETSS